MKIKCSLAPSSIDAAIKQLEDYRDELETKAAEIAERLANAGFQVAFHVLAQHIYSGETISNLQVQEISPTKYRIVAGSVALLFLEFGAGMSAVGHPLEGQFGMGAGTYPGQKHAFDEGGWWFPTDDPNLAISVNKETGVMYGHSKGNPPYMPMYNAAQDMRSQIEKIAREVFKT